MYEKLEAKGWVQLSLWRGFKKTLSGRVGVVSLAVSLAQDLSLACPWSSRDARAAVAQAKGHWGTHRRWSTEAGVAQRRG